jgi:hypothetical protein
MPHTTRLSVSVKVNPLREQQLVIEQNVRQAQLAAFTTVGSYSRFVRLQLLEIACAAGTSLYLADEHTVCEYARALSTIYFRCYLRGLRIAAMRTSLTMDTLGDRLS